MNLAWSIALAAAIFALLQSGISWLKEEQKKRISPWTYIRPNDRPESIGFKRFKKSDQAKLMRHVPEFFDLLSMGLGAGHTVEQAFVQAARNTPAKKLRDVLLPLADRLRFGISRDTLFEDLQKRLGSFGGALALLRHALKHGAPLERVLREQAEALRRRHQLALEKKAQTIGLKLLLPIGVFILPALLLLFIGGFFLMVRQDGGLFGW